MQPIELNNLNNLFTELCEEYFEGEEAREQLIHFVVVICTSRGCQKTCERFFNASCFEVSIRSYGYSLVMFNCHH